MAPLPFNVKTYIFKYIIKQKSPEDVEVYNSITQFLMVCAIAAVCKCTSFYYFWFTLYVDTPLPPFGNPGYALSLGEI